MEDLLVRYAVVHGLSLINESWALEILDTMRIDEKEWVVRDLAQQAYEILEIGSPYLPQNTPFPHEAPWLIDFAAKQDLPSPTIQWQSILMRIFMLLNSMLRCEIASCWAEEPIDIFPPSVEVTTRLRQY